MHARRVVDASRRAGDAAKVESVSARVEGLDTAEAYGVRKVGIGDPAERRRVAAGIEAEGQIEGRARGQLLAEREDRIAAANAANPYGKAGEVDKGASPVKAPNRGRVARKIGVEDGEGLSRIDLVVEQDDNWLVFATDAEP
jgi:hypothetical protein